ncbi:MAG: TRAP transporter substrate-binding protein [Ponticaulis sp.]|nr:TRAP transporter substrate-binding protein [Ponticaulis sp.]|tara:strand:- start:9299 stop:10624 length:1326 start_codon:yes stop_codon:yes gene_type:complete
MSKTIGLYGLIALVVLVVSIILFRVIAPPPPKTIRFASGSVGGAYSLTAEKYRELVKEESITLEIFESTGSGDNLEMLRSGEVDAAIVQGGVALPADSETLRSLGAVFYEPLWVFYRGDVQLSDTSLEDLRAFDDLRIAAGTETSGTRSLANQMLEQNGVEANLLPLSGPDGAEALLSGDVDVLVTVTAPTAPFIRQLLANPSISVLNFERALAYERRTPYLKQVIFPEGGLDLENNLPSDPIELIAPVAQVVVREDLHPAVQALLLEVMVDVHRSGTLLSEPGVFPTPNRADLPVADEATRYYENGPTFLRRYFPFGVANFLERAWVLLIPMVTLLIPLVRAGPPIYRWRTRRKIYVWYRELKTLEARGRGAKNDHVRDEVIRELRTLQAEVGRVEVPESYTDELYRLRSHILFVSQLMKRLDDEADAEEEAEAILSSSS